MEKRVLAFVDKEIGRNLAEYCLNQFPRDEYVFVVGPNERDEALMSLSTLGHRVMRREEYSRFKEEGQRFDWLLNLWGHDIFREDDLAQADRSLNIHPGYLPFARGSDPVVWTLKNGWPAGVTLHELTLEVDGGPIWAQDEVRYAATERGGVVYARVVEACERAFKKYWPGIRSGVIQAKPQPQDTRVFKRKELWADREVPFDDTLKAILRHDFNEGYTATVIIDGVKYNVRASLTPQTGA